MLETLSNDFVVYSHLKKMNDVDVRICGSGGGGGVI
jgi:hypothetical protein